LLGLAKATHDAADDVMATVDLLAVLINKLKINSDARSELFKKYSGKFIQLSSLINNWEPIVKEKRPAEALEYIWNNSGLKDYYENDEAKERRFKSIDTLIQLFKERDDLNRSPEVVIRELINYASLTKDINFLGLDQGKIPVVTVHQVKGLEFDYVFIVGANESIFPMFKATDIEEERRLFYVAITRARQGIYISYSNFNSYNGPLAKSRFIGSINEKFVELIT
jgi:DNA helicase-2/ATP-dependent DNA helicase PcrA